MGATEKVVVRFVGATLGWTAAGPRLVEAELLDLEREDFVNPFREALLFGEGEQKEGWTNDIPVYRVECRGEGPVMVLAQIGALLLASVEATDLGRYMVGKGSGLNQQ
jgi:hypothetical protein